MPSRALGQGAELLLPESHRHESLWIAHRLAQGEHPPSLHPATAQVRPSAAGEPDGPGPAHRRRTVAGIDKRYRRLGDECAIVRQLTLEAGDFARLFARTPMPMCITRMTDGTVLAINTSFQSFMGRTEEACWATARWTWACGDRPASAARCWSGCTGKDACTTPAGRAARWAGRPRPREVLANIEPVTLGGQPCLYVLLNDISGWRQAERQLQRRDREFADLVNSASDAIVSIDAHQRVCLFNRAAEQMFQVSAEEALGQTLDRFIPGDGAAATRPWCSSSSTAAPKPGAWAAAG
jgi:PAS domain-containing protein